MSGALSKTDGCLETGCDLWEDLPTDGGLELGADFAAASSLFMNLTFAFVVLGLPFEMSVSTSCRMLLRSLAAGSL